MADQKGAVSFMPLTDFKADAFGDGNTITFRAGVPSSPVPQAFYDQMIKEGKAKAVKAPEPAPEPVAPVYEAPAEPASDAEPEAPKG